MSPRTLNLSDTLYAYLLDNSLRESEVMRRLREETATLPGAGMQIGPEQGQFMALLVELMGAKRCLEIGTCDVNEKTTAIARRYWAEAGVAERIELRLAPALETLAALIAEGAENTFDFVFIDADKTNYDAYYEMSLALLRPGGLIAVDNVLWDGAVTDSASPDPSTRAIRALNAKVKSDQRVSCSLLPVGDGLLLALKRKN